MYWLTGDMEPGTFSYLKNVTFDFYKKDGQSYNDCVHCPARYWATVGTHWCIILNKPKNHKETPTCTEHDWDKFVLEHV